MRLQILMLCFCFSGLIQASELKPFKSDGCSSFPDGTLGQKDLWLACCYQHDLSYWKGGSVMDRKKADVTLQMCVEKVGEPTIAKLMLAGVRVGGTPYLPTSFRWAYGWPYLRGYKVLSADEILQVKQELEKLKGN